MHVYNDMYKYSPVTVLFLNTTDNINLYQQRTNQLNIGVFPMQHGKRMKQLYVHVMELLRRYSIVLYKIVNIHIHIDIYEGAINYFCKRE